MKDVKLYVPMWPTQSGSHIYGCANYGGYNACDSTWISFRAKPKNPSEYEFATRFSVWPNIGLYVWFDGDGTVQLEFRAHDVFSADETLLDAMLKTVKWANKRLATVSVGKVKDIGITLFAVLTALKVEGTIVYRPGVRVDEIRPLQDVLTVITADVMDRFRRIERKSA